MISRIRSPLYIFFLNPVYVAARSLRSLRSNKHIEWTTFCLLSDFVLGQPQNNKKENTINKELCQVSKPFLAIIYDVRNKIKTTK